MEYSIRTAVSRLPEARQEGVDGRAHVADHGEIDRCAAPDDFRSEIDLGDPDLRTARIELSKRKSVPSMRKTSQSSIA
jgi:hypothetical protein